jgi:hypothetical protein
MFPVTPTLGWLIRTGIVRIVIAEPTIAREHIRQTLFKGKLYWQSQYTLPVPDEITAHQGAV